MGDFMCGERGRQPGPSSRNEMGDFMRGERGRQPGPSSRNEDYNSAAGLKLLYDVIQDLNPEQIYTIQRIVFGTTLELACSSFPYDVFNWLAPYIDTSTGSIDLPNGFSFTMIRECVNLIFNLPLGPQSIPFCSSPDVVQMVNKEIHGKEYTPSVYELAHLIRNGLSGSAFAKAFVLLEMCTLFCPTNQCFPSSSYYNALVDVPGIFKEFDWCSYVLQWLLLSVNKHAINDYNGFCGGCGLIPVISYFEFLIVSEVRLGVTIPRIPLWTDNVLKLYAILDSKDGHSFGKLQMKHMC